MAEDMFETIIQIQPKDSGGGAEVTREEIVYEMASDILVKLPLVFNMFVIKERYCVIYLLQMILWN